MITRTLTAKSDLYDVNIGLRVSQQKRAVPIISITTNWWLPPIIWESNWTINALGKHMLNRFFITKGHLPIIMDWSLLCACSGIYSATSVIGERVYAFGT